MHEDRLPFSATTMPRRWGHVALVIALALAAGVVQPAAAGSGSASVNASYAPGPQIQQSVEAVPAPDGVFVDLPSPDGLARATAHASFSGGALRAGTATTGLNVGGATSEAHASAFASWTDSFVIAAPGHAAAESGTIHGTVRVDGNLAIQFAGRGEGQASVGAWIEVAGRTTRNSAYVNAGFYVPTVRNGSATDSFVIPYDVPVGLAGTVTLTLNLYLQSYSIFMPAIDGVVDAGSATGSADSLHTMTWQGIAELRDANGQAISDFTAISETTGIDYRHAVAAVPEPGTGVLLMAGLGGIAAMVHGRRGRRGRRCLAKRHKRMTPSEASRHLPMG
jgi:hypothetical protein